MNAIKLPQRLHIFGISGMNFRSWEGGSYGQFRHGKARRCLDLAQEQDPVGGFRKLVSLLGGPCKAYMILRSASFL